MIYIRQINIDCDALREAGSYVAGLPFLRNWEPLTLDAPVTFFIGENGSGKSTLIEGIAVVAGFNPEGGSKNFNFSSRASHSDLCDHLRLTRGLDGKWRDGYFLRAESFYNVASNIEELDRIPAVAPKISEAYGERGLHEQSHGESFLALMRERFFGRGLYILDEPEAALSPARILAMMRLMKQLVAKDSQFIISTHSPILTAFPGAAIYQLGEHGIRKTAWERTDNVLLTKRFLSSPESILNVLFDES